MGSVDCATPHGRATEGGAMVGGMIVAIGSVGTGSVGGAMGTVAEGGGTIVGGSDAGGTANGCRETLGSATRAVARGIGLGDRGARVAGWPAGGVNPAVQPHPSVCDN